jgi:urocanate hydratase
MNDFQKAILQGLPDTLPAPRQYDTTVPHAPVRKDILTADEKKLALRNALRYFDKKHHAALAPEFLNELKTYGRIYMYRFSLLSASFVPSSVIPKPPFITSPHPTPPPL